MSGSTSNLDTVSFASAGAAAAINALSDAGSPATLFGKRASTTSGLTGSTPVWGYYGGTMLVDGVLTIISNGTVSLIASDWNYIEADRSGSVSTNNTGFTAGRIALYKVNCATGVYDDYRAWVRIAPGFLTLAMADANKTLTHAQANCDSLELTGALTALRDVIVPLVKRQYTIFANTTGGFGVRIIGASGTGITVADGKRAIVQCDGTNVVRLTADV